MTSLQFRTHTLRKKLTERNILGQKSSRMREVSNIETGERLERCFSATNMKNAAIVTLLFNV